MADYICTQCGWEGERKRIKRGSKTVETLIWSVLMLPGPIYSYWRRSGRSKDCPNCGLPMLVKLNSDEGWLARRKFDLELGIMPAPKIKQPDAVQAFGNEKPAGEPAHKKPVNPDEW